MREVRGKRCFIVAASLAIFFTFSKVAVSQVPGAAARQPSQDIPLTELSIPENAGRLIEIREAPTTTPEPPLLILIQDAHVNYQAQQNLAKILSWLAEQYSLRLVLVEGGHGSVNLAFMRGVVPEAVRHEVAAQSLRDGHLSGEEFLQITSDLPLSLWGIEDPKLYESHYEAFLLVEQVQPEALRALGKVRQLTEAVSDRVLAEPLKAHVAQRAAYEAGTLTLGTYASGLAGACERVGLALARYPQLRRFVALQGLESGIDLRQVTEEQRQVIDRLRAQATPEDLQGLTEAARRIRLGKTGSTSKSFYRELARLTAIYQTDLRDAPHLDRYLQYVKLKMELDPKTLWVELDDADRELTRRLATTAGEQELMTLREAIGLYERLMRLEWLPRDYEAYRMHQAEWQPGRLVPALVTLAGQVGVPSGDLIDPKILEEPLARAVRFYDAAEARDQAMVQRALEKLRTDGVRVAAVVAGGFHTDHLAELLGKEGISVAIVIPFTDNDHSPTRYVEILKAKHGRSLSAPTRP